MSKDRHIVLFRAEREEDDYRHAFREAGFEPHFVPVLRTALVDRPEWPADPPDAVVVTSRRSLLALTANPERLEWLRTFVIGRPWYAVGPATARAVERLGFRLAVDPPGTSAQLADPLLEAGARRVLLLAGDPHRRDLEEALGEVGVPVDVCVLYRTVPSPPAHIPVSRGWAVLFSPRGVTAASDLLLDVPDLRLAAIGPTTASALKEAGLTPSVIAPEPSASALLAAIEELEKS